MRALGEAGLKVPDDMAIVGMDDIDFSSHPLVELTTVRQDLEAIGKVAAEILIDRIEQKITSEYKHVKYSPQLIIRKSCGYQKERTGR